MNCRMRLISHADTLIVRHVTQNNQDRSASGKIFSWDFLQNQDRSYGRKIWLDNITCKELTPDYNLK